MTIEQQITASHSVECPSCGAQPNHRCLRTVGNVVHIQRLRAWRAL